PRRAPPPRRSAGAHRRARPSLGERGARRARAIRAHGRVPASSPYRRARVPARRASARARGLRDLRARAVSLGPPRAQGPCRPEPGRGTRSDGGGVVSAPFRWTALRDALADRLRREVAAVVLLASLSLALSTSDALVALPQAAAALALIVFGARIETPRLG